MDTPQSGKLANDYLKEKLRPAGYYEVPHTPGLWKHISRPIEFTLVVDDFGVKYVGREHANHLIKALKKDFTIAVDEKGELYCGITLKWDYEKRLVDISMPGYIKKVLQKYKHEKPKKHQGSPYQMEPKKYGTAAQEPIPPDTSRKADEKEKKNSRKHSVLCKISQLNSTGFTVNNCNQTNSSNRQNNQIYGTTPRLHGIKSRCNNEILCIRHDTQHSL